MIPILQFDPSSLTLWYDAQLIAKCRGSEALGLALERAVVGDDRGLQKLLACVDDPWVQTRAANIASVVWHEKRHFLDFVLTNYGALRIRHFFEIYANVRSIFHLANQTTKKLLIPLDSNLDPILRRMTGVGDVDERLLQVARAMSSRKEIMTDDRRPVPSPAGAIDVGGEALMEAIAYHVQNGKTHRVFGYEMSRRVQLDNPGDQVIRTKYRWAYEVLVNSGLLSVTVDRTSDPPLMQIDDAPFIPLCYGALAGRFWGQKQTRGERVFSYLPAHRFVSLMGHLDEEYPDFPKASCLDAWEMVNRACKTIFGRSVYEEIDADFAEEEKAVDTYERLLSGELAKAYADLHKLRGRLIGLLRSEPELFLDQGAWADRMVNRLQPVVVVAASAGEVGKPPEGFERLSGYSDPGAAADETSEERWWWAAIRKHPTRDGSNADEISVGEVKAWAYVTAEYAPMAKLLYAGHNMRVMLGPELVGARIRFQEQTGIKMVLDPQFAYPKTTHDVSYWYFITGRDEFRCDLSSETVRKPEGYMLDPWDLRLRPGLPDAMVGALADGPRMRRTIWRDWSPWLVSEEFRGFFESFRADEKRLYETLAQ
jgi:hypothetical protein